MLAVAIVPLGVLGVLVLDIQRTGLARAEKELEAAVVDEAAVSVAMSLDRAAEVGTRVGGLFAADVIDPELRMRMIRDVVGHAGPSVAGVAFFDETGHFVDAIVPAAAPSSEAFREAPLRGARGFRVARRTLRWEAPLEGSLRGTIAVVLAEDALDRRLHDLSVVRFGAADRVYLVDASLAVIGGRASARPTPIFAAAGFTAAGLGTELLLTTEFREDGVEKVGTIRTMPAQKWALVVERPTAEAFAALASARRAFLLGLAVFAALAAIAALVVVRRVLGPIGSLMALVKRYGRREFSARSAVHSGDELEALGASLEHMADDLSASEEEIAKRARIEENLRRYMPAEAAVGESLDLGGAKRRVTVLFADVVGFTSFAESTSPEQAVAFLNELFTILSEIVFRHGGMVDKFIGDCIMAVFRPRPDAPDGPVAPVEADDVARALAAAEDMHSFVESNLPRWRETYAFDVELGIGVSTGEVLLGNLGSATRMEYTVIGDAVNVASRLESLARPRQTLATREIALACPEVRFVSLREHALRGKAQPVEVFEVVP